MAERGKKTAKEGLALVPKRSRRDVLLDEAARQLNARGISQTALIDLAAALGLSRAAVYYYADDRQDLVFQCYRRACEALARELAASSSRMSRRLRLATSASSDFAAFFPRSAIFLLGIRTYAYVKTLDKEYFYVKRCQRTQVSNPRQTDGHERGKGGTG